MSAYEALAERIKNIGTCIERARLRVVVEEWSYMPDGSVVRHLNVNHHRVSS